MEFRSIAHEPSYQKRPFCKIRPVLSPLYGDSLMKRPLRYRTMGAVREGREETRPPTRFYCAAKRTFETNAINKTLSILLLPYRKP